MWRFSGIPLRERVYCAYSRKMTLLPGLLFVFIILRTCFCVESDIANASSDDEFPKCPGKCVGESEPCSALLNETDCETGFVCCVDHLEKRKGEFDWDAESDAPIEQESDRDGYTMVEMDPEHVSEVDYESNPGYVSVYSDESDILDMGDPDQEKYYRFSGIPSSSEELQFGCPGACVPEMYAEYCEFVVASRDLCEPETTCCVTEEQALKLSTARGHDVDNIFERPHLMKRSSPIGEMEQSCPGTCVHPSHFMYCERILPEYPCPLNSKCCTRSVPQRIGSGPLIECTGQCLRYDMHSYCFPPLELVVGTTCASGSTCCMKRSPVNMEKQSQIPGMAIPPKEPQIKPGTPAFLGHLAIDDADNIFKVSPSGQISPLPRLSSQHLLLNAYSKVTEFDRPNGKISIYADKSGLIYQHFARRAIPPAFSQSKPSNAQSPLVRQPIRHFESQASEHAATFQGTSPKPGEEPGFSESSLSNSENVVIPDDDDEPSVPTTPPSKPVTGTLSRPPCPGSCMSYFLRFTCFRGFAIYDGFTCSGKSVCCARLKDIEEHEQYLKSLSPYFNAPPAARDPNLPRCGLKGRRDTPRVIGGKDALPGEWCWQVAVINTQNQYICGAALIDDTWALTAAHCVLGLVKENKPIFIRAGVTDLKSPEDNSKGQTVRVLSTFVHHNFNNMNLDNDIALLRLQKPLKLGANICLICLPTSGQMPDENTKCTVTGYGFVSAGGDMSLKIREAQVPIIDDMDCITNVTEALGNAFILPGSSFCAGGQGQQDACQGDAGGPLACEIGGFHELVGLVSWGLGCGRSDVPSIYIKVPAFMGWINHIIGSSSFVKSLN